MCISGLNASRVLYEGQNLLSFKMEAISLIVFSLVIVLGPLMVFTMQLWRAKRKGLIDYGVLANRYVEEFENKWVTGIDNGDQLLGTGDIQSLADLGNSYAVVREMRRVPFDLQDVGPACHCHGSAAPTTGTPDFLPGGAGPADCQACVLI